MQPSNDPTVPNKCAPIVCINKKKKLILSSPQNYLTIYGILNPICLCVKTVSIRESRYSYVLQGDSEPEEGKQSAVVYEDESSLQRHLRADVGRSKLGLKQIHAYGETRNVCT